jgi:hypothetical protein
MSNAVHDHVAAARDDIPAYAVNRALLDVAESLGWSTEERIELRGESSHDD